VGGRRGQRGLTRNLTQNYPSDEKSSNPVEKKKRESTRRGRTERLRVIFRERDQNKRRGRGGKSWGREKGLKD